MDNNEQKCKWCDRETSHRHITLKNNCPDCYILYGYIKDQPGVAEVMLKEIISNLSHEEQMKLAGFKKERVGSSTVYTKPAITVKEKP